MMKHGLDDALRALGRGEVVAVATESSFGLLADIHTPAALQRLFELKRRGMDKGVGLVVPSREVWRTLVARDIDPLALNLARRHWPGAVSIALPAAETLDPRLTLGGSIAVRVPGPCPALDLIRRWGGALTATSANLPGEPPCLSDEQVRSVFADAASLHVVAGNAPGGPPSTLVVVQDGVLTVARPGAVPADALVSSAG